MNRSDKVRYVVAGAVLIILIAGIFALLVGQIPQPSISAETTPAPTEPSPSPEPLAEPSPTPLPAPLNFHRWGSITLFNGLPSDSVRAIAQTSDGIMWFGTDNGLARFDGRRIQKYSLGSPDADRIRVLRAVPTGELWIGTGDGLFLYGEDGYRQVAGTERLSITSLFVGAEIVFGTGAGTVSKIVRAENGDHGSEMMTSDPIMSDNGTPLAITGITVHKGKVLAATAGGGLFEISDGKAIEFPTSPRPIFVNAMTVNGSGKFWIAADAGIGQSGIYEYAAGSVGKRLAAATAIALAVESNDGGVWAGTERNGLFHFDGSGEARNFTFANTSGGLRSDFIFTLFTDREGVIWIGTNRGVSRFDGLGPLQETVSDSPNGNFIRSLFRTSGGSLYAGSNRGLFESRNAVWTMVGGYERRVVHAIAEPSPMTTLIGTATGTFDISGRSLASGDTRAYAHYMQKTFAAVFSKGVIQLSTGRGGIGILAESPIVVSEPAVTTISAGRSDLWIGTSDGRILSYDGTAGKPSFLVNGVEAGAVRRIIETGDATLWIAAESGVFRLADGQMQRIVDVKDVRDLYIDGEDIWAATATRGLVHARRDETFGWLLSTLGFEQGLPSEKMFAILPMDDALLIASNRGVVTYRPGKVAPKIIASRVLSQRGHEARELRSTIELEYPQNSLVVEVAGLSSRTSPQEFQYGFLVKNERGEVIEKRLSFDSQFAPSDLKAGGYTIEARAFDRDLLASEPLMISFRVARAPFPWTATALGVLLAIAIVALIWAIVERRRIALRNRDLAAARFDLANEAERERSRIARDLHDQTLADLRSLMIKTDRASPESNEFRTEIEAISTEIRRICEDLSPSVLENVGLIAALEHLLTSSIDNHRFRAPESADDWIRFPINVQLQVYRIAREVLTNIQRHANASTVEMDVKTGPEENFRIEIADDGDPFDPNDRSSNGRGINNIKTRAALIQAKIAWERSATRNFFTLEVDQARHDHDPKHPRH